MTDQVSLNLNDREPSLPAYDDIEMAGHTVVGTSSFRQSSVSRVACESKVHEKSKETRQPISSVNIDQKTPMKAPKPELQPQVQKEIKGKDTQRSPLKEVDSVPIIIKDEKKKENKAVVTEDKKVKKPQPPALLHLRFRCPMCYKLNPQILKDDEFHCKGCKKKTKHVVPTMNSTVPDKNHTFEDVKNWKMSARCDVDRTTKVKIMVDNDNVIQGGTVSGVVMFKILQKTKVSMVTLELIGTEHIRVIKADKTFLNSAPFLHCKSKIFKNKKMLSTTLSPMAEELSFEYDIPKDALPTVAYGVKEGYWVEYRLRLTVIKPGSANLTTQAKLVVLQAPISGEAKTRKGLNLTTLETTNDVVSCGCCVSGSSTLKATLDRTIFAITEGQMLLPMRIQVDNQTDKKVRSVTVTLEQSLEVRRPKKRRLLLRLAVCKDLGSACRMHSSLDRLLLVDFPLEDAIPGSKSKNVDVSHVLKVKLGIAMEQVPTLEFPLTLVRTFASPYENTSLLADLDRLKPQPKEPAAAISDKTAAESEPAKRSEPPTHTTAPVISTQATDKRIRPEEELEKQAQEVKVKSDPPLLMSFESPSAKDAKRTSEGKGTKEPRHLYGGSIDGSSQLGQDNSVLGGDDTIESPVAKNVKQALTQRILKLGENHATGSAVEVKVQVVPVTVDSPDNENARLVTVDPVGDSSIQIQQSQQHAPKQSTSTLNATKETSPTETDAMTTEKKKRNVLSFDFGDAEEDMDDSF
ncbi:hypothetical protein AAMO2058_000374000 [Amorphochlora amoebiformis]